MSVSGVVTSVWLAEHYKQEPDKVAAIVLLGNMASLLFVPVGCGWDCASFDAAALFPAAGKRGTLTD